MQNQNHFFRFLNEISRPIYLLGTGFWFIFIFLFLFFFKGLWDRNLQYGASVTSFLAGLLFILFFYTLRETSGPVGDALAILYWSSSIVLFSITMILVGISHLILGPRKLTQLTGISFLLTGVIGMGVGYIGGFTLIPFLTFYDYPWVTAVAIVPCLLGIIHVLKVEKKMTA